MIKTWYYALLPADSPKGYERHIFPGRDGAMEKACGAGSLKLQPGRAVEVELAEDRAVAIELYLCLPELR